MKTALIIITTLSALLTAAATFAQGSGDATIIQNRNIADFQRVELHGRIEARIEAGDDCGLALRGDVEDVDAIVSQVLNGTLVITAHTGLRRKGRVEVVITARELTGVSLWGTVKAVQTGFTGPLLQLTVNDASSIEAGGRYEELRLSMNGAASTGLAALESRRATVHATGVSRAILGSAAVLDGTLSDASHVIYLGRRSSVDVRVEDAARLEYRSGQ